MSEDVNGRRVGPLLLSSLEYVWSRIRGRLSGLTADEYLWEPVPGCWSVRPGLGGGWEVDRPDLEPSPPPVTTIAWRLWHIASGCLADYTSRGLGPWPLEVQGQEWYPSPDLALDALDRAWQAFYAGLVSLGEDGLWRPLGPAWEEFADDLWHSSSCTRKTNYPITARKSRFFVICTCEQVRMGNCLNPNRISSSGRRGPGRFRLDQPASLVLRLRRRAMLNCNPNCNLQIRRSGQVVQDRLSPVVRWADVPYLSAHVSRSPVAWQQYRQQPKGRGTDPRYPGEGGCVASRVIRGGGCLLTDQRAMVVMPGAAAPAGRTEGMT